MKRVPGWLIVALAAGVAVCSLWPSPVVTVRLPEESSRLAFATGVHPGERIVFRYRHSVEQTVVEGVFEVRTGSGVPDLVLVQTRYGSTGSGLPNEDIGRFRREGGRLAVDSDGTVSGLTFRVHAVNAAEVLIGGETQPLHTLPSGTLIRLDVESVPQVRFLLWRVAGRDW